jgi:PAS domain S-box-containing protein
MRITRLRNKLLLSASGISLLLTLGSMLVVSWVIDQQFHDQTKDDLRGASEVIESSLAERKDRVQLAARQLATQKNLGSTIWYLAKYGQSNVDREMLSVTYQQLAKDTHQIARVAKLSRIALYDYNGHLVSFASIDASGERAGFVRRFAKPVFQVATLKEGEELNRNNLRTTNSIAGIASELGGALPQRESVNYAVEDGILAIKSRVPIMGEVINPVSGKQEIGLLGLVVAVQPIDQGFVGHLSRSANIDINIFTSEGFSSGSISAYRNPDWSGLQQTGGDAQPPAFSEISVDGKDFYQSLLPLYNDTRLVGGIAALHSKEVARKNTLELIQTLGLIAAVGLSLVISLAWYFATTISRPLTVLSRIFRDVASGKQTGTQSEELARLKAEQARHDELGDLTQSFIAMNESVNQKIRQINEINASLGNIVSERTAALAAKEQESRTLIENSPDTIARYDQECRRIFVNPAFGALAEGGMNALLGKKPSEVPGGPNAEVYEAKIKEVLASGKNTQFELKWQGKDGKEMCSHIRLTPERDLSGAVTTVLAVGRDISELNEYRTELKLKESAKSRFLSAAGHDLRQPLAAANLFIDALRFTAPTAEQNKIIQRLDQAMVTFNGLLDSLLNISKLDSGTIKPEYTSIDVSELFEWIDQSFAPMASEKKIGFKLRFPTKSQFKVRSDIGLLKSVLMNLVSNAIKFTSEGGVLVSARHRGREVLFQIWDTGIGIPDEYIAHVFDEFYQINNPQRDRTHGIGLGLSIAKRAISLLGGTILCRSRSGAGSVFEFRLSLDEISGAMTPQHDQGDPQKDGSPEAFVHGKRFVVLEDDALIAAALSNILTGMGGSVKSFHNAEIALSHPDIGDADYYIVDFMVSGALNGIQFLNTLRRDLDRPVKAVLMTGDTSPAFVSGSKNIGWPVLYKPANISKVVASLRAQT